MTAFFNTVSSLPASSTGFTRVTKMSTGGEKRVGEGGSCWKKGNCKELLQKEGPEFPLKAN